MIVHFILIEYLMYQNYNVLFNTSLVKSFYKGIKLFLNYINVFNVQEKIERKTILLLICYYLLDN
jgi:hypothetical protein